MDQINYLPDHILAEILGNLSPRMIKCCALVCKRWDNIVGTSKELMGRFELDLYKSDSKIQEAKNLHRNHQTAMIKFQKNSLDIISCHNLQSLSILGIHDAKLSLLIKTLNSFPSLKKFNADFKQFIDDVSGTSDIQQKTQNKLITLKCDLKIIHIFDCCTVEKLKLNYHNPVADASKLYVAEFLKKQENLKSLIIYGESDGEFFNFPGILKLNMMKLKKFTFYCRFESLLQYEVFIKFLDRHKNSLTSLDVCFSTDPQFGIEFIHKFALEKIVNLKHLNLGYFDSGFDSYVGDELSYNELPSATEITKNLESLAVRARSSDMNENQRFYNMFPNLKCLDFGGSDHAECPDIQFLHCINERCVNIEKFVAGHFDDENEIPGIIYFPKLKEFSIDGCTTEESLCAFINRHSQNLERISIGEIHGLTHLTTKEILNCKKLIYLKLGFFRPNLYFFGMLSEISSRTTPFTLDFQGFKNRFKFPDDKAIWDEEIEDLESKIDKKIFRE